MPERFFSPVYNKAVAIYWCDQKKKKRNVAALDCTEFRHGKAIEEHFES